MRSVCYISIVFFCVSRAPAADATPEQVEFFEKKIRPVLVERCQECHGPDLAESKLRVDSLRALLAGGERGPAIMPGKGKESLLIRAVGHGETLQMPPKQKLSPAVIADLTEWINRGAAWPNEAPPTDVTPAGAKMVFSEKQKSHWAFQPVADPSLPVTRDLTWPRSTVDAFVLAKLEAAGLTPTSPAGKPQLLRRVSFDLTGLPPTPDELATFLADESPDAYERLLDRLLSSPAHGEKFARHWLDLARYADSNGLDENVAYANAYRYRDYVTAAFNRDKPYDRFVQEQLAGDLLPAETEAASFEQLTATGFLSLGAKMLAEDDPVKMQMDIIDEQLDTLGKCFLGMTLGCARCHDHKFDPIDSLDYYGLAGILKSTKTMQNHNVVAMWNERPIAEKAWLTTREASVEKIAAAKREADALAAKEIEAVLQTERARAGDYLWAAHVRNLQEAGRTKTPLGEKSAAERAEIAGLRVVQAESFVRGNVNNDTTNYGTGIGILVNRGERPNFVEYELEFERAGRYQFEVRYAAAESRPVKVLANGAVLLNKAADDKTGGWNVANQKWFIEGVVALPAGKVTLRFEQPQHFPHLDQWLLSPLPDLPAEVATLPVATDLQESFLKQWQALLTSSADVADSPLAPWHVLTGKRAADSIPDGPAKKLFEQLNLESASARPAAERYRLALTESLAKPSPEDSARDLLHKLIHDDKGPFAKPKNAEELLPAATRDDLKKQRDTIAATEKALPPIPVAMAVSEGKPEDLRVHLRGNHLTLGATAPRQFPRIVAGDEQSPLATERSGRLELAQWMTSPQHPLTARVIVNRVWQWHFGEGLVRSSDNFGLLGEAPSHPELLDHLAKRFTEDGWSFKRLHRRLLTSATYLQATGVNSNVDPDNRLLAHFPRRRLQAEEIRDAILHVSEQLNRDLGGSHLPTANHAYVNAGNKEMYRLSRRSLYLPLIRSALYDVFQAFDFADPSVLVAKRDATTVAPQALFMLNSQLTADASAALADAALRAEGDDRAKIQAIFTKLYARAAEPAEIERARHFLATYTAAATERQLAETEQKAWRALCRGILSANEFVYTE